ncbi:hypothetical protein FQA39_LY12996 [Lamprigera yunnana]|nr:hypothetical protein FQA39_LY12996 [Lamprigera yunnana]
MSNREVSKYIDLYMDGLNLTNYKENKFITDPEIIILDEPTANLDVQSRLEFMDILAYLSKEHNKTIMITSHNIDELNNLITRAVLLKKINNKGQIIYDKVFDKSKENLRQIYVSTIGKTNNGINFEKIKEVEILKDKDRKAGIN